MAQDSYARRHTSSSEDVNPWAVGVAFFACMMMMLLGGLHIITGITAILDDSFYVTDPNFSLELDVTTWGWLQLIGGGVVVAAGFGMITGSNAARIITVVIAGISIIWSFYSIPYYPVWSIIMIVFAAAVIWSLTAHGRDVSKIME